MLTARAARRPRRSGAARSATRPGGGPGGRPGSFHFVPRRGRARRGPRDAAADRRHRQPPRLDDDLAGEPLVLRRRRPRGLRRLPAHAGRRPRPVRPGGGDGRRARPSCCGAFADRVQAAGLLPCLFSVTQETADHAARAGAGSTVQVAEEAVIDLPDLEFTGKAWQDVRTALNQAAKQGLTPPPRSRWPSSPAASRCRSGPSPSSGWATRACRRWASPSAVSTRPWTPTSGSVSPSTPTAPCTASPRGCRAYGPGGGEPRGLDARRHAAAARRLPLHHGVPHRVGLPDVQGGGRAVRLPVRRAAGPGRRRAGRRRPRRPRRLPGHASAPRSSPTTASAPCRRSSRSSSRARSRSTSSSPTRPRSRGSGSRSAAPTCPRPACATCSPSPARRAAGRGLTPAGSPRSA